MVVVEKQKKLKLFIILQITRAQKYFFNRFMPCSHLSFLIASERLQERSTIRLLVTSIFNHAL